jgi:hypothetical protein
VKDRVDAYVRENGRFTIDELHIVFPCFAICSLLDSQFNFRTEKFVRDGLQECSQMNTSRNAWILLSFLYTATEVMNSWTISLTGHEAWVSHCAPKSKWQSQGSYHDYFPTTDKKRNMKIQQTHSVAKSMASICWDRKHILLIDVLSNWKTSNAAAYTADWALTSGASTDDNV